MLIQGETGTGKGLFAHGIHSSARQQALVAVNCAAIPETLLERASVTPLGRSRRSQASGLFEIAHITSSWTRSEMSALRARSPGSAGAQAMRVGTSHTHDVRIIVPPTNTYSAWCSRGLPGRPLQAQRAQQEILAQKAA